MVGYRDRVVHGFPGGWLEPAPDTFVAKLLSRLRPQPHTFVCGVRWPDDDVHGLRWHYHRAWVDQWRDDDTVRVRFSDQQELRLRIEQDSQWSDAPPAPRAGLVVLSGRLTDSDAVVLLAVPPGNVCEFDVDIL